MLLMGQEGHATEIRERRYGENRGLEVSEGPVVCLKAMLEIRCGCEKHVPISIRPLRCYSHKTGRSNIPSPEHCDTEHEENAILDPRERRLIFVITFGP